MKKNIRKNIELAVLFGLICAILLSFSGFSAACDDMRDNILRLHIIPNSDSTADQTVKFLIRDGILEKASELFSNDCELSQAVETAREMLPELKKTADRILIENGFDYHAEVELGEAFFETRDYKDFSLPAGVYESLIIRLGKAEGQNWWCVVFPSVCIPAASDKSEGKKLSDSVQEKSVKIAGNKSKYRMKFKTVEIYEELKRLLSGE